MKYTILFLFSILFNFSSCEKSNSQIVHSSFDNNKAVDLKEWFVVTKVVDGDTFWIKVNDKTEKIRLIGIDAPESRDTGKKQKQYFGVEAKIFLTNLLLHKKVKLEFDVRERDKYGRLLAYVYLEDNIFLNEFLVKNGYAIASTYQPNVKYQDALYEAQKYARKNKKGLWN